MITIGGKRDPKTLEEQVIAEATKEVRKLIAARKNQIDEQINRQLRLAQIQGKQ